MNQSWYNHANNISTNYINRYTIIYDNLAYVREGGCIINPIYVGDSDYDEELYAKYNVYEGRGYIGIMVAEDMIDMPLRLFATEDIERFFYCTRVDMKRVLYYECAKHIAVRQKVFEFLINEAGYTQYCTNCFTNRFLINAFLHMRDLCDIGMIIEHTIDAMNCSIPNPRIHNILE